MESDKGETGTTIGSREGKGRVGMRVDSSTSGASSKVARMRSLDMGQDFTVTLSDMGQVQVYTKRQGLSDTRK